MELPARHGLTGRHADEHGPMSERLLALDLDAVDRNVVDDAALGHDGQHLGRGRDAVSLSASPRSTRTCCSATCVSWAALGFVVANSGTTTFGNAVELTRIKWSLRNPNGCSAVHALPARQLLEGHRAQAAIFEAPALDEVSRVAAGSEEIEMGGKQALRHLRRDQRIRIGACEGRPRADERQRNGGCARPRSLPLAAQIRLEIPEQLQSLPRRRSGSGRSLQSGLQTLMNDVGSRRLRPRHDCLGLEGVSGSEEKQHDARQGLSFHRSGLLRTGGRRT